MCMDKPKISERWTKRRMISTNINDYLIDLGFVSPKIESHYTINKITPFLQEKYGGSGDCTLTSILTVVKYYKPELDDNVTYNYIEKVAKKYFYNEKIGTFPGFNKGIVKEVFKHFNIEKSVTTKYFKKIGFNENTIINQLKQNHPVIISIQNDGRNYYTTHTITIMGYISMIDLNNKKRTFFKVYDNWFSTSSIIDYEILRQDCMICY